MNGRTHSATTSLCSTESERRARSTCVMHAAQSGRGMKTRFYRRRLRCFIHAGTSMFHSMIISREASRTDENTSVKDSSCEACSLSVSGSSLLSTARSCTSLTGRFGGRSASGRDSG